VTLETTIAVLLLSKPSKTCVQKSERAGIQVPRLPPNGVMGELARTRKPALT